MDEQRLDAWGQPLKDGHCKYHPVIGVPYPCPLCEVKLHEEHVITESIGQPNLRTDAMWLVYANKDGDWFYQYWRDVADVGTLIDPDTGDDLELIGWTLV